MALDLGTLKIGIEVDDKAAKQELEGFSNETEGMSSKLGGKLKNLAKVGAAAAAAAAAAAGAAMIKIGKEALEAYAKFEQLEGGVAKLFGDGAQEVMKNAQNAYKTAGISANEYMEQVTSFSASLIQSLDGDTQRAAKDADIAMQDMADNANVFGTSMESIQNAYQGFAKQNYTMLDNLKLGYGGTKEEMQRLLDDASKLTGIEYDIANFDDIIMAIHAIQEEQKIAGTTANEASNTIEGSVNAAKAAWQNFLIGLGDENADMDQLIDNLFKSIVQAAKNIVPRIGVIIKSMIKAIGTAAKKAAGDEVGRMKIIDKILQALKTWPAKILSTVTNILNKIADGAGKAGTSEAGKIAAEVVATVATTVAKQLPGLIRAAVRLAVNVFAATLRGVISYAREIFAQVKAVIVQAWNAIKRKVREKLRPAVDSGPIKTLKSWIDTAKSAWNSLKETLRHPIKAIVKYSKKGSADAPGKRIGIREVPYDNYLAELHKGEAVLTAAEANQYNKLINKGLDITGMTERKGTKATVNETQTINNYSFGDITVDVSKLEDIATVDEFVALMQRAKAFI